MSSSPCLFLSGLFTEVRRCQRRQGFECYAECLDGGESARIGNLAECAVGVGLKQEHLCLADALVENISMGGDAESRLKSGFECTTR